MLSLYYHEFMKKIKTMRMVNNYMLDKVLETVKEKKGIVKFDDTKNLIDRYDKVPDYITLKNVVISIKCVIKDDAKFHTQIFLEQALYE